jgi:hypothetical protein
MLNSGFDYFPGVLHVQDFVVADGCAGGWLFLISPQERATPQASVIP